MKDQNLILPSKFIHLHFVLPILIEVVSNSDSFERSQSILCGKTRAKVWVHLCPLPCPLEK